MVDPDDLDRRFRELGIRSAGLSVPASFTEDVLHAIGRRYPRSFAQDAVGLGLRSLCSPSASGGYGGSQHR